MKNQLLFLLVLIFSLNCYSQITFEKGYFIDNSNKKVDCLIKNNDWGNSPKRIEYKLSEESEQKTLTVNMFKEFGIYNESKYVRKNVNIDKSRDLTSELDNIKAPNFKQEQLLLKVLVEGKASLYEFFNGNLKKYFYTLDGSKIEQLFYKRYITPRGIVAKNNQFKQQLFNSLKCQSINKENINQVSYKQSDLVNLFVNYNTCSDNKFTNFEKNKSLGLFNLSLKVGINNSSLSLGDGVNNVDGSLNTDFGNKTNFRFGIETEFIFNFNKNKWAIVIEPTYQYYKSENSITRPGFNDRVINVDYTSIELPLGLRHYFFLNNNSKLFVNAFHILDFAGKSAITVSSTEVKFNIEPARRNYAFGLGYNYNNKYSLEFRYNTTRSLIKHPFYIADYNTFSIIFGYKIL